MQRRKVSKLSSSQARAMVTDLIASRLEVVDADSVLEGFILRMSRVYGRGPTDGEVTLYRKEFAKLIGNLLKRGQKAREDEETGHEK